MEKELQKKSLENFFRTEYHKLVGFVRSNLDERYGSDAPEDIVQDVALSLISKLDPDTQIRNLTGYIYRSVKNRIIDYRNKKQRNVSIDQFTDEKKDNYLLNTLADETLAEESGYADIDPEKLREAIGHLRPDEQAVIMATVFENQTYEELSAEWDIPVGTLLSRKHRALSKLHKYLLNN